MKVGVLTNSSPGRWSEPCCRICWLLITSKRRSREASYISCIHTVCDRHCWCLGKRAGQSRFSGTTFPVFTDILSLHGRQMPDKDMPQRGKIRYARQHNENRRCGPRKEDAGRNGELLGGSGKRCAGERKKGQRMASEAPFVPPVCPKFVKAGKTGDRMDL